MSDTQRKSGLGEKKCWSCAHYAGARKKESNLLGMPYFKVDGEGFCTNERSEKGNGFVKCGGWCSKYARAGDVEAAKAEKDAKTAEIAKVNIPSKRRPVRKMSPAEKKNLFFLCDFILCGGFFCLAWGTSSYSGGEIFSIVALMLGILFWVVGVVSLLVWCFKGRKNP